MQKVEPPLPLSCASFVALWLSLSHLSSFPFLLVIISAFLIFHHFLLLRTLIHSSSPQQEHPPKCPHTCCSSACLWFTTYPEKGTPEFSRGPGKQLGGLWDGCRRHGAERWLGSPNTGQVSRRWKFFPLTLPPPCLKRQWVMMVMFTAEHMLPHMSSWWLGGGGSTVCCPALPLFVSLQPWSCSSLFKITLCFHNRVQIRAAEPRTVNARLSRPVMMRFSRSRRIYQRLTEPNA